MYIIFDNLLGRATEGMKENIDTDHSSDDHDLTNATIEDDTNTGSDSDKTSKKSKTKYTVTAKFQETWSKSMFLG